MSYNYIIIASLFRINTPVTGNKGQLLLIITVKTDPLSQ